MTHKTFLVRFYDKINRAPSKAHYVPELKSKVILVFLLQDFSHTFTNRKPYMLYGEIYAKFMISKVKPSVNFQKILVMTLSLISAKTSDRPEHGLSFSLNFLPPLRH